MSTFGEWLQEQRNQRRLTRVEFAQRVGCSVAMLRKIETDERRPSAQIAELIAGALGLPASDSATFVRVARGELGTDRLHPAPSAVQGPEITAPQAAPRSNLPLLPTPLIGRQRELTELRTLVRDPTCRMLTLVGPGGIGKTRLAIEAASQAQDAFADGAYFVPLAPVDSSNFIVPVIAHSIGFVFRSAGDTDPKTQLFNFLQDKRMLLLLDNVEHLLNEPGINLIAELLACAPTVKTVVTSRESMNLQVEWVYAVQGLPVPDDTDSVEAAQDTSIELFLQRARRANVAFNPTNEDQPAIVRICRLLDGMPLPIELAAAWVRTLTCAEIGDEIEHSLDFLSVAARDLPPRHRSMRAVFDHSWQLLSDDQRGMLARLSVFRGGFGREAAEHVAGASLGTLSSLVAKSLVRRLETGRYDLHEVIREYAELHLDAEPAAGRQARQQHCAFYLDLAEAGARQLKARGQLEALRRLEEEHDNFRTALAWSLSAGEDQGALRLAAALAQFWGMRGYFDEGRDWLRKVLGERGDTSKPAPSPEISGLLPDEAGDPRYWRALAAALEGFAVLENAVGRHAPAYALAERSMAICRELDDKQGLADALMIKAHALRWQGDAAVSHALLREAVALYREVGDRWNEARCLLRLGGDLADFGGDAAGEAMLEEGSTILEDLGDVYYFAGALALRGIIAGIKSDYDAALSYLERALSKCRELKDPWGAADALTNIGGILRIRGDYLAARSRLQEASKSYQQVGVRVWWADAFCALAENEMAQGNLSSAHVHLQEAMTSSGTSGNRWLEILIGYFDGVLAYYEGNNSHAIASLEKVTALAREGQYRPDLARSLVSMGVAMTASGETGQAQAALTEGMQLHWESGNRLGVATAFEGLAQLIASKAPQRAARFFGVAEATRAAIGAPLPPVDRPVYRSKLAAARAKLGKARFEAAAARGRSEPLQAVVAEILASSDHVK